MGFIFGIIALVTAFCVWQFLYNDTAFDTYIKAQFGSIAAKWKLLFWLSVLCAAWAMLTFVAVPAYVAMLVHLVFGIVWLSSPAGQNWLKSITS